MALRVEMTGNSTGFKRMLEDAKMDAKAFSEGLGEDVQYSFTRAVKGAFTGLIGYEVFDKIRESFSWFQETGTQIKDISDQLGMSTDEWQKWADAVDQAHLSTEGFVRIIEALKEKRIEALTDPKARAQLTQLGFTDADISGSMSTSDFVQKALANSNNNQWTKQAFDQIAGTQGARYTRALGFLPSATAEFSPQDLADAEKLQQMQHNVQKGITEPIEKGITKLFIDRDFQKAFGLTAVRLVQGAYGRGWLWNRGASWKDGIWNTEEGFAPGYRSATAMRDGKPVTASEAADIAAKVNAGAGGKSKTADDPMKLVLDQQNQEFALRDQERNQRITEAQRSLMTIEERFASIRQEMGPLRQQIAQREGALKTPEGFLTDAQRQQLSGVTGIARTLQVNEMREKYMDQTADLKMRLLKDQADLRQGPLNFQADNLAKVGLYSANALAFNPVLGIGQKTNELLGKIVQNTSKPTNNPPNDPHRP